MKHVSGLLHKLTVVAAAVVALSSCNRAEYAMLPQTSSYHGTEHRSVSMKPAPAPETAAAPAVVAPEAPAVAAQPAPATPAAPAARAAAPATTAAVATPAPAARKLNLVERALVSKVAKQADKLARKAQVKKHSETASANKLSGNLRTGIILILVGLLISLLSPISGIFGLIGGILAIIGIVLIILYLLDEI
ncbi:hypothetical protein E5K00_18950 [Hymenobacter aquaticus]|uniref:Uncharacterized protein n=1 Tax=Hymenobacter aquaticus TaxID=1867101 RepID=A0A4Z0PYC6_9BACT|nr:hypothetical protein [Hymenobacter aquaticus]TGE22324.1 hypothetical protein E5K00_18950 [Hymenobacter aquaticus]